MPYPWRKAITAGCLGAVATLATVALLLYLAFLSCFPLGPPWPTLPAPESPELLEQLTGTLFVGDNEGRGSSLEIRSAPRFERGQRIELEQDLSDIGGFVADGRIAVVLERQPAGRDLSEYELSLVDVGSGATEPLWYIDGPHRIHWLVVGPGGDKLLLWSHLDGLHVFVRGSEQWSDVRFASESISAHEKPVWLDERRFAMAGETYGRMPYTLKMETGKASDIDGYHNWIFVGDAEDETFEPALDAFNLTYNSRLDRGLVESPATVATGRAVREMRYEAGWITGESVESPQALGSAFYSNAGLLVLETVPTEGDRQEQVHSRGGPGAKWSVQVFDPRSGKHATLLRNVWHPIVCYQEAVSAPKTK